MNRRLLINVVVAGIIIISFVIAFLVPERAQQNGATEIGPINGPLRVSKINPRYFTDNSGKAIYLTGLHTFQTLQDEAKYVFNYDKWLDFMVAQKANHLRVWVTAGFYGVNPIPFDRTGPGKASDGGLKFDVGKLNQAYFDKLRRLVEQAEARGIYVQIMLTNGIFVNNLPDMWEQVAWNPINNVNGYALERTDLFTMKNRTWVDLADRYVDKVVDSVNDLDNVLYEVSNEASIDSKAWQYHVIDRIHAREKQKPKQHPVGMGAFDYRTPDAPQNAELLGSDAEFYSLSWRNIDFTPPVADGKKVSILDSDHVWGFPLKPAPKNYGDWIWKAFTRGHNPIYLDTYILPNYRRYPPDKQLRNAIGYARTMANKIDLDHMIPDTSVCSTGFALVNADTEYLIYQPAHASFTVMLPAKTFRFEWLNPTNGKITDTGTMTATAGQNTFVLPKSYTHGAVLHLATD